MVYPCDFEIKRNKEQEIRERVQRAATDRLLNEMRLDQPGFLQKSAHAIGHLLMNIGKRLDQAGTRELVVNHSSTIR